MRCLVIYDITDDKARNKIADACLDYGLERIQYSAFAGKLGSTHQRELERKIRRLLPRTDAKVRILTLDERTWEQQRIIERASSTAAEAPDPKGDR
jgi:CRISPR-associated protein Cas2